MSHRPSEPPDPDLYEPREEEVDEYGRPQRPSGLGVSDFLKRTIKDTVGSVQSTGTLSKEAIQYLLQQGDKGRREVLRIVANEVGNFLRDTDLSTEVIKILTGVQVEFNANVKFKPADPHKVSTESDFEMSVTRESEPPLERADSPPPHIQEVTSDTISAEGLRPSTPPDAIEEDDEA